MKIYTAIGKEYERLFEEKLKEEKMSKWSLSKKLLEAYLSEEIEIKKKPETLEEVTVSGNFEEDVKEIDSSAVSSISIKKAIEELDNQKKIKNSMKKGGAFHEENCIIDLKSMISYGKPDFHELKYHFDWWYNMGLLTNVLARRGVKMSKKHLEFKIGFEKRNDPAISKSSFEDSIRKHRLNKGIRKKQ